MRSHFRVVIGSVIGISVVMIIILVFHVGGDGLVKNGDYTVLVGALIGTLLVLVSTWLPTRQEENIEPWLTRERLAWALIGCGLMAWTIGEGLWNYYQTIGQSPFPSVADIGFSSFPPLVFAGLILQPSSKNNTQKRMFLILDSLIVMGALLSIGWFLLLGALAQAAAQTPLAKFLSLYYPIADIALLSCLLFLLLRGPGNIYRIPARRMSLLLLGVGLCVFATSDFLFNVLNNQGLYVTGSWVDLGWSLGIMTMGVGAYLRRFLPGSNAKNAIEEHAEDSDKRLRFGPTQLLPYFLLIILFVMLGFNVLSPDKTQQSIRPVLLIATLIVISLVIVRQIITMQENDNLVHEQINIFKKLEKAHHDIETRKIELEEGVNHLKDVQTRLANGDMRARAQIMGGDLWPLATGLNLMADRMMRSEHDQRHAHKLVKAISDLSMALEGRGNRLPAVLPASCLDIPELQRLLIVLGLRPLAGDLSSPPSLPLTTPQPQPSASPGTQTNFPRSSQRATP